MEGGVFESAPTQRSERAFYRGLHPDPAPPAAARIAAQLRGERDTRCFQLRKHRL